MSLIPGVSKHAREQFLARFGFEPSREHWLAAVLSIIDRKATLLSAGTHMEMERWQVQIGDVAARVLWAADGATIVTVLPPSLGNMNPRWVREREAKIRWRRSGRRDERRPDWRRDIEAAE